MTDTKIVNVGLGERAYDIHIGKGLLEQVVDLIPTDLKETKVFILYDKNTYPYVQVLEKVGSKQNRMMGYKTHWIGCWIIK